MSNPIRFSTNHLIDLTNKTKEEVVKRYKINTIIEANVAVKSNSDPLSEMKAQKEERRHSVHFLLV